MKTKRLLLRFISVFVVLTLILQTNIIHVYAAQKTLALTTVKRSAGLSVDAYAVDQMMVNFIKHRSISQTALADLVEAEVTNAKTDSRRAAAMLDETLAIYGVPNNREFISDSSLLRSYIRQSIISNLPIILLGSGHQVVVYGYRDDAGFEVYLADPNPSAPASQWSSLNGLVLSSPAMTIQEVIRIPVQVTILTDDYGTLTYTPSTNLLTGGTPPASTRLQEALKTAAPYLSDGKRAVLVDHGSSTSTVGTYVAVIPADMDPRDVEPEYSTFIDWNVVEGDLRDVYYYVVLPVDTQGYLDIANWASRIRDLSLAYRAQLDTPASLLDPVFVGLSPKNQEVIEHNFAWLWYEHVTWVRSDYWDDALQGIMSAENRLLHEEAAVADQVALIYQLSIESILNNMGVESAMLTLNLVEAIDKTLVYAKALNFVTVYGFDPSVATFAYEMHLTASETLKHAKAFGRLSTGLEIAKIGTEYVGKYLQAAMPAHYLTKNLEELKTVRDYLVSTSQEPQMVAALNKVITDMEVQSAVFWERLVLWSDGNQFAADLATVAFSVVWTVVIDKFLMTIPLVNAIYIGAKLGFMLGEALTNASDVDECLRDAVVAKDIYNVLYDVAYEQKREQLSADYGAGYNLQLSDVKVWSAAVHLMYMSEAFSMLRTADAKNADGAGSSWVYQLHKGISPQEEARDFIMPMAKRAAEYAEFWTDSPALNTVLQFTKDTLWNKNIAEFSATISSIDGSTPPVSQQKVSGVVPVGYSLEGTNAPFDITLWVDGMPWYSQYNLSPGSYTYNWDTASFYDGNQHLLRLEAKDSTSTTIVDYAIVIVGEVSNQQPSLSFTDPASVVAFRYFIIHWQDADPDDNAFISLGYDANNTGCDGTEIIRYLSEDWTTNWWTWRDIPGGAGTQWYVYGVIDDGHHDPTCVYGPRVTVEASTTLNGFNLGPVTVDDEDYGNGNAIWEDGEAVELRVDLTNITTGLLDDVWAELSTTDSRVALTEDDSIYYAFYAGDTNGPRYPFHVALSNGGQTETIPFQLNIYYRQDGGPLRHDVENFTVTILPAGSEPGFMVQTITFADTDLAEANGNGILESGEDNVFTTIRLRNTGSANATNVRGTFTQPDGFTRFWGQTSRAYPDIPAGGDAVSATPFRIDDIPAGFSGPVTSLLTITYGTDGQFSKQINVTVNVQPVPRLRLTSDFYSFGQVSPGDPVTHDFTIENIGSAAANISEITVSHPDLTFTNVPASIPAGSSATITAHINTTGLDATIERTFTIHSNAHSLSQVNGKISGTVHAVQPMAYVMAADIYVADEVVDVVTGDTDGDGLKEILYTSTLFNTSGSSYATRLTMVEQTATNALTFHEVWNSGTSIQPAANNWGTLAAGDLNNDGKTEIALVTNSSGTTFRIYYLYSNGNNQLAQVQVASSTAYNFPTVTIGDSDGDGMKEIITSRFYRSMSAPISNVVVYEYTSGTSFALRWTSPFISAPYDPTDESQVCSLASADTDQDGRPEIQIGTNNGQLMIYESTGNNLYNNTAKMNIQVEEGLGTTYDWCDLAVGDTDKDGKQNIIYTNEDSHQLWDYETSGNDTWPQTVWNPVVHPTSDEYTLAIGDTNNNGNPEIITSYRLPGVVIYETFGDNSYSEVYRTEDPAFVPDIVSSIALHNFDADPEPEIVFGSDYYGYWVWKFTIPQDLVISNLGVQFTPSPTVEQQPTTLNANVTNSSAKAAQNVRVDFYLGDPAAGGTLINSATIASINASGSGQASITGTFAAAGSYAIYAVVDPANTINETNETNNKAHNTITVNDNDIDPPVISNVAFSEYNGDGDGLLEDDEQIRASWNANDPAGIFLTNLSTNCTVGAVTGAYQVLLSGCAAGSHGYTISAADNDNSRASSELAGSFEVINGHPVVQTVQPGNAEGSVLRSAKVRAWFGTPMMAASLTGASFTLSNGGTPVAGTVAYDATNRVATFSPSAPMQYNQTYVATLKSGVGGIRDSHNNTLTVDYTWNFTTLANTAPAEPTNPIPAEMAENVADEPILHWSGVDANLDPLTYKVYFGPSNPPTEKICDGTSLTSCNPGHLSRYTWYYWRVVASDGLQETSGPVWRFRTLPADTTPPVVSGVTSIPDTDDHHLLDGEVTMIPLLNLVVTFSEAVNDPEGDSDLDDVTNPENYKLLMRPSGTPETLRCADNPAGGDSVIHIDTVIYNPPGNQATLILNEGAPLSPGTYRLLVCGSTSISDLAGNKLDGDFQGTAGDDFILNFVILPEKYNLYLPVTWR